MTNRLLGLLAFTAFVGTVAHPLACAERERLPRQTFTRSAALRSLALSAPLLECLDDDPAPCKICARQPAPALEPVPVPDSTAMSVTPAGAGAPFGSKITGKVNWPAYGHGEPGQCTYGGCSHRPRSWSGDVEITTAPRGNNPSQSWEGALYWDGTQLATFTLDSDDNGDIDTVALTKTLPCDITSNQTSLEIKVMVGTNWVAVGELSFTCAACTQ